MPTNCPSVRWLLGAAVLSAGCGGGGGGGGGTGPNRTLAIAGGNTQIGNAGAALANPLAVVVLDATTSTPAAGVTITWAATLGGGSVTASSITDATGIATAIRTLGSDTIAQATTASGTGLSGSPVTFVSTSRIQGATQMQLNAGNSQSDTIGSTLGAYEVLVRNETGTAVANVTVNWTAAGGGSVSAPSSVTNASGIASVNRILGTTTGAHTAQARVAGLSGNPVNFGATATAGNVDAIEKTAEPAAGVINSNVTYTVTARDRANNPKAGVTIDWAATGGGGSIAPAQNTTDANGEASATRTLSGTIGAHTATATAPAIASTLTFTTTATTAPLAASVTVGNDFFNPTSVTIAATGVVTWTWNPGGIAHNVTFSTAGSPTNIANRTTGSENRTFPTPGTFNYTCTIHAGMAGSVTVQ
ncbi:MAG TPA: Ig-like domain-containing protein [Gemmatimonadales bacterium]